MVFNHKTDRRIKCNRSYLEMAKLALEEAGGQYEPTEEELRDQAFNRDLTDLNSFTLEIGDYFYRHTKYKYTISGEKVILDAVHYYSPKPSNLQVYDLPTRKGFLQGIEDFHIGEWKQRYENLYVLDGIWWTIRIEYNGNKKAYEISGENAYPYNFEELLEFLNIGYFDCEGTEEDDD